MDNCGGTAGTAGCHDGKTYTAYLAGLTTPSPALIRQHNIVLIWWHWGIVIGICPQRMSCRCFTPILALHQPVVSKVIGTGLPRSTVTDNAWLSISGQAISTSTRAIWSRFGVFAPRLSSEIFDHLII